MMNNCHNKDTIAHVSQILIDHWSERNVYTKRKDKVVSQLNDRMQMYLRLLKYDKEKRQGAAYKTKCEQINMSMNKLFDIARKKGSSRQTHMEAEHGVPNSDEELSYLESM